MKIPTEAGMAFNTNKQTFPWCQTGDLSIKPLVFDLQAATETSLSSETIPNAGLL